MYASLRSVLATAAACALLAGCGDSATNGVAILASDVVADAAPLADADTPDTAADVAADVAPDTTSTADAAEDAAPDVAPDVLPDAPADVDAATDLVQPVDAADAATAEDIAPDTAATDTADDTADADAAVDAVDAVDVADIADVPVVPACTSAADCGGDTPYCSPAGACVACVVNNACSTAVNCVSDKDCTPIGAVCDSSKGVCRECLTGKDCSAGQTCKANQCGHQYVCCATDADCNDGAAVCTNDSCVNLFCEHTPTGAAGCCTPLMWQQDMESDIPAMWTASASGTPKWQWTQKKAHGGTGAIWYGNAATGDFSDGSNANTGALQSTAINLPMNDVYTFSMWVWLDTENGPPYDELTLSAQVDG